jgi:hypothetical protein
MVTKVRLGWVLPLAICLVGLAWAGGAVSAGIEGTAKADSLDACVAPTPFMRRSHFELIMHQRDITVHEGIRETDNSLHGCVDCHVRKDAQGQHVAVNAPGEFCAACHEYTATTLDCFTCHATTPVGNEYE